MSTTETECRWTIVYAYITWALGQGLLPIVIYAESVALAMDLGLSG